MGTNKATLFGKNENTLAEFSKALAHPARVAILSYLSNKKDCLCGDITDELPLAQSTVSQHLKVLKEAGLIVGEVEGTKVCYCLNAAVVQQMHLKLMAFTENLSEKAAAQNCQLTDLQGHKSITIWDRNKKNN